MRACGTASSPYTGIKKRRDSCLCLQCAHMGNLALLLIWCSQDSPRHPPPGNTALIRELWKEGKNQAGYGQAVIQLILLASLPRAPWTRSLNENIHAETWGSLAMHLHSPWPFLSQPARIIWQFFPHARVLLYQGGKDLVCFYHVSVKLQENLVWYSHIRRKSLLPVPHSWNRRHRLLMR